MRHLRKIEGHCDNPDNRVYDNLDIQENTMSYAHTSSEERSVIHHLLRLNYSHRSIAKELNRHHSTISREIKRNQILPNLYLHAPAQQKAETRVHTARHAKRSENQALLKEIHAGIKQEWSPAIISAKLKKDFPRQTAMRINPETLYQWVYADAKKGGKLYKSLWKQRHRRKPRRGTGKQVIIPNRVGIEQRPLGATNRSRYGHWEGDTVEGPKGTGGLATHVERKSRYLLVAPLTDKASKTFTDAGIRLFCTLDNKLRRTLTLDNGTENAQHERLTERVGIRVYFANPYSPWERGSNEQANGLLRRYFPKGTDFSKVPWKEIQRVVDKINRRPRKCLNYQSPYEVFSKISGVAL